MSTDDLQAWIEAVDRLDTHHLPSRDEMRAVARDVGLDEAVLERAEARAEELGVRGRRFLDNGLAAEAVTALTEARALEPWSLELLEWLGRAQLALFRTSGDGAARAAAERIARTLIEANAHDQAGYAILAELQRSRRRWLPILAAGLVATLGLVVLGAWWGLSAPTIAPVIDDTPAVHAVHVGDLDVEVVRGPLVAGMEVEVTSASVTSTSGGEGWIAHAGVVLRDGAPQVVSRVIAVVKALDADGHTIGSSDLELVASHHPALYQGDRTDGEVYVRGTTQAGTPAKLVVEVTRVDAQPGTREAGAPVQVRWDVPQPSSVDVAITARDGGACTPSLGAAHCGGVFVAENTGTVPIDLLELRVEFGGGEHGRTYAISARDRAVGPGERTPFRVATRIDGPPPPGPWTLVVTKVRTP
ncbi:MAG: hypothetical protein KC621_11100 [Myxococcales bacterium]|nr:hypothetical protein [Myxococcales bacterium]